jgi:peptidoglycan/LPS O-acetylase OafA/YrhL
MAAGEAGEGRTFVPRLEAARGVAALLVAAFHAAQAPTFFPGIDAQPVAGRLLDGLRPFLNGHGAVIFFFVLSGFVLSLSLQRKAAAVPYFISRVFRLFPAIVAAVLVFAAVFYATGYGMPWTVAADYAPEALLRHMLLLNVTIVGVMWSLQAELLGVPLILAAVMLRRRWGVAPVAVLAGVLLALSFAGVWSRALSVPGGPSPTAPLYCFVFGVLVQSLGGRTLAALRPAAGCLLLVAAVSLFFGARPAVGYGSHWGQILEAIASAGIIGLLAYAPGGGLARPLDWPIVRFYGRISYSFYLLHALTLMVLWRMPEPLGVLAAGMPRPLLALLLSAGSILAVTPLAWLSWRYVELPGIALGRRATQGWQELAAALPAFRRRPQQPTLQPTA